MVRSTMFTSGCGVVCLLKALYASTDLKLNGEGMGMIDGDVRR